MVLHLRLMKQLLLLPSVTDKRTEVQAVGAALEGKSWFCRTLYIFFKKEVPFSLPLNAFDNPLHPE